MSFPIMPSWMALRAFHHWSAEVVCDPTWSTRAGLPDLAGHRLRLLDRVGHRLLEVDVLPGRDRRECHRPVPVVGSCDDDRVHVRPGEDLAIVKR